MERYDRRCDVCGESIETDRFFAMYGVVKLNNKNAIMLKRDMIAAFDACPKCLQKIKNMIRQKTYNFKDD